MTVDGDRLLGGALLAIFAGTVAVAAGYPAEARLMPLLVGSVGGVLCVLHLLPAVVGMFGRSPPRGRTDGRRVERRREMVHLMWFVAFVAGILTFGFLAASPVLVFAFIAGGGRERWIVAAGLGLGTAITLYGVFELIFRLPLFPGFAAAWLVG